MGKKYLDTKKNSLEDAVLEVFIKESVLAGRDYKYDGKGPIKISKKMYGKDSKNVNVNSIVDLAKTLNKRFVTK